MRRGEHSRLIKCVRRFYMKFIFTCGGTAGHINPAIAVAGRLKELIPSCEILFIGAEGKMEMDLVPREGYDIKAVKITNVSRQMNLEGLKHNIDTFKNIFISEKESLEIIKEFQPDAVIGTGGYVCYPVLKAAHKLGIPTLVHESNAEPGLTTKRLAKVVDKVLVGFDGCQKYYPDPSKVEVTGTPVRGAFSMYTKESAKAELGIPNYEPLVVSVWGSLGAQFMNDTVAEMVPIICDEGDFRFIHSTGKRYYDSFMEKIRNTCPNCSELGVDIREYIHDMARVMTAADLIICRAGASTLSELAFMGKPCILVPSPNVTGNHQEKNARVLENAGAAVVMLENEITARTLFDRINQLLLDNDALYTMSENMSSLAHEDSAEKICSIILEMVNKA